MDDGGQRARFSPVGLVLLLAFAWVVAMTGYPLAKLLFTGAALSESEQGNVRLGAVGLVVLVLAVLARLIWRRVRAAREPSSRSR